ncbi:recQ-mediated genome instability protein 1-like [Rutidosis leptorrhynchoides]|uniref:recQ-mediated genome instability protein 1-like n=1 Tax=Rutidosis leptorrhynchoides TaxID=125765 RepID=UPI003A9950C6
MPRRRLRLTCVSDDEEADDEVQIQNPPNPPPAPANQEPVTIISDDDFVDVSDNLSTPSPTSSPPPPPPPNPTTSAPPVYSSMSTGSPIGDLLAGMGLRLKNEWLDACVRGLEGSGQGFAIFDLNTKAKLCFEQFLFSDMNRSGGGVLPENVHTLNMVDLKGPFVLQVDEIVNISCPLRGRYQETPPGIKRCLKLSMTDGVQRVFAMEYKPINDLKVFSPAGLKVAICNVHVRRGLLMLVPEAFTVLGGMVEELEAARERLVTEVNKPPRGKRTREGAATPLSTRATHAAWPSNVGDTQEQPNVSAHFATPLQASQRAATSVGSCTIRCQRITETVSVPIRVQTSMSNQSSTIFPDVEEMHTNSGPESRTDVTHNMNSDSEMHVDTVPVSRNNVTSHINSDTTMHVDTAPVRRQDAANDLNRNAEIAPEDIHMATEFENPHMLSGFTDTPFTYMARLSSKWAAMNGRAPSVQGKIKCFLTGVKGFQYKQRTTYELHVYVDDGSLISEILIDHNVVQRGIGYSPGEVTAALSSSDKKICSDMKHTLKQFQKFLANFEGTMLVQINESSHLPVAHEMSQGCTAYDARSLLRRCKKSLAPAQAPVRAPIEAIDLSP